MAKIPGALRKCVQAGWGILSNAYVKGFMPGGSPIYKGELKRICVPEKIDRPMRYLKYVMLFVMVFALPFFVRSAYGVGAPLLPQTAVLIM